MSSNRCNEPDNSPVYADQNKADRIYKGRFKSWSLENRLRLKYLSPNDLVAYSPYNKHHFFDGYADGVGIWIECSTATKATFLAKKLERLGARVRQRGGCEIALYAAYPRAIACAFLLKLVKGKPRGRKLNGEGRDRGFYEANA